MDLLAASLAVRGVACGEDTSVAACARRDSSTDDQVDDGDSNSNRGSSSSSTCGGVQGDGAERAGAIPCGLMAAFDEDEWFEQQAEKLRQQNLPVAPMASFDEDAWIEQQAEKMRQQNLSVASSKLIETALLGAHAAGSMRPEELGEHQGRAEKRSCTMFEHSPELAAYGGASKLKRSAVHRTELPHALHSGGSLIAEIGVLQSPPGINVLDAPLCVQVQAETR